MLQRKKSKAKKWIWNNDTGWFEILEMEVRIDLTEKMAFESRLEETGGAIQEGTNGGKAWKREDAHED